MKNRFYNVLLQISTDRWLRQLFAKKCFFHTEEIKANEVNALKYENQYFTERDYQSIEKELKNKSFVDTLILISIHIDSDGLKKLSKILENNYQIKNLTNFIFYLSEQWKTLSKRSDFPSKGISRTTFSCYYNLPGLISRRLFKYLDKDKNGYLSPKEFITGMVELFGDSVEVLINFIFEFYDFDDDGKISKEDINSVLTYIPNVYKFEDIVTLQDELFEMLNQAFGANILINKIMELDKIIDQSLDKSVREVKGQVLGVDLTQTVCDEYDEEKYQIPYFLNQNISYTFKDIVRIVKGMDGLVIPAHIDRKGTGILDFIEDFSEYNIDGVEIYDKDNLDNLIDIS